MIVVVVGIDASTEYAWGGDAAVAPAEGAVAVEEGIIISIESRVERVSV